jgi:hypothetical protein
MKKALKILIISLTLSVAGLSTAQATLIDRGNGMIYDSDQNITWLQDANYAQTSNYDTDGRMTWGNANTWVGTLSVGGYNDWRLATINPDDIDGCNDSNNGTDCGYNVDTSTSELAYLWYDILGNTPYYDINGSGSQTGWGLSSTSADGVDFLNVQSSNYWSGTEYATSTSGAWGFYTYNGVQRYYNKDFEFNAWAVRSGDVAASVPEPSSLLLLASGLLGFTGVRGRQQ